jgi:hypothetical protein
MTIRRVVTFAIRILIVGVLLVTLAGSGDGKVAAATKTAAHFQTSSEGNGERFLAGPFEPGTQLGITSFTVTAPKESAPIAIALHVAHGAGSSCQGFVIAPSRSLVQVPAGNTLHLVFPQPLIATDATQSWCLWLETDVFTGTTIVGVRN